MQRSFNASKGGAKPPMLGSGSSPVFITVEGRKKAGIYESALGGAVLARRVELPEWLAAKALAERPKPLLKTLSEPLPDPLPRDAGSRGHVFLSPDPSLGFQGPAVGLDLSVAKLVSMEGSKVKTILFFAYAPGYRLVETWSISRDKFLSICREHSSDPSFDPQSMVPVSALSVRRM